MEEIRVSVRRMVEFLLRQGDIDNRRHAAGEEAVAEGGRIHRMLQKKMGSGYRSEVSLRGSFPGDNYVLVVEGRADGILDSGDDAEGRNVMIDEIKGTYRDVDKMKEPVFVQLAQARCYAYLYGRQENLGHIKVRMTYCNLDSGDIRYFYEEHDMDSLEEWFLGLIGEYRKWADFEWSWKHIRQESIEDLEFPFPYREGQRELAGHVYRTIYHRKKLFLEAPTGVGKTVAVVFPAVKAVGRGLSDKIFYLTAKSMTRTVAEDTIELLRQNGMRFKSVTLTAKEKICFMEEENCNPTYCPYACGHYDRINAAVYDFLTNEESFTRQKTKEYARRYRVCPYELCLDMSVFADGVICDYNHLFDPHVYLKRFFTDNSQGNIAGGGSRGENIFLIDEAHNLLERGREMYSAALVKEEFADLSNELKKVSQKSVLEREGYSRKLTKSLDACNKEMLALKRGCDSYIVTEARDISPLVNSLNRLLSVMDSYLDEQEDDDVPQREDLLNFFFKIRNFMDIYELVDDNYAIYTQLTDQNRFMVKLFCTDPSRNLAGCMARGRSSILFSATLLPIQYYKSLLGGDREDYEVYAESVFSQKKRALLIARDVTSRYDRRTEGEFEKIACYIEEIVKNRDGNYMVFLPSYTFMHEVAERYLDRYALSGRECLIQEESMSEQEREAFLDSFSESRKSGVLIGFCVLGGVFGEGIDLKCDRLIGTIIVGTGIPGVCAEREILKDHFDEKGENGFDYSYRYPGMNNVLQAAGRLIRTSEDVGVIALLDERFLQPAYLRIFPREWENFKTVSLETVAAQTAAFWSDLEND